MNKPPTTESTTGTRIYKIAQRLTGLGIAIVPTYPGEHGAKFSAWQNQATTFMSTVDQWMNQGYPLANGPHIVTPDHNWVCVAKRTGVGCLDIDNYEKCLAMGMPPLPEDVFTVDTPGGGLHIPFIHTPETMALNNKHDVYENDDKDDGELIFELKGGNTPWCGPWQARKDGGYYKPRVAKAPLMVGIPPEVIAWLLAHSDVPRPNHTPVEWEFDEDFDVDDFVTHHSASLNGQDFYDAGGSFFAVVEECPICGTGAGSSTARAAKCKFIFGGRGRGGYKCQACGISGLEELETALQEKDPDWQPWDEPVYKRADTSVAAEWTSPEELEGTAAAEGAAGAAAKTEEDVRKEIDAILRSPGLSVKNPDGMTDREKEHLICQKIFKHLKANGKLFNCGNVATFVDNKRREIIQITKGNPHFTRLLLRYGVFPADKLTVAIGMFLGSMATTAPENTIYTMSFYDREHVLYVNEYDGNFLKIDATGAITRMRNGTMTCCSRMAKMASAPRWSRT